MHLVNDFLKAFKMSDEDIHFANTIGTLPSYGVSNVPEKMRNIISEICAETQNMGFPICAIFTLDGDKVIINIPWLLPTDSLKEQKDLYKKLVSTGRMMTLIVDTDDPSKTHFMELGYEHELYIFIPKRDLNDFEKQLTNTYLNKRKQFIDLLSPNDSKYEHEYLDDELWPLTFDCIEKGFLKKNTKDGTIIVPSSEKD